MKKISILLLAVINVSLSFAQVQRTKPAIKQSSDSLSATIETKQTGKLKKREMMRELNLTKEQKGKLKEIKQANKEKTEEVLNNDKLTQKEKDARLKTLHQQQAEKTLTVLNDEQKAKIKKMRTEKRKNKKGDTEMDNQ